MSFGRHQRLVADRHALRALLRSVPPLHCNPVVPRVPRLAPAEPCDPDGGARGVRRRAFAREAARPAAARAAGHRRRHRPGARPDRAREDRVSR